MQVPANLEAMADDLVHDLEEISKMAGEYRLTPAAVNWGEAWYQDHYSKRALNLDPDRFGGYIARKQTHVHKLAMVLSAAQNESMLITPDHLSTAHAMITDLEPDMQFVFSKIGRSDASLHAERLVNFITSVGEVGFAEAYRHVHSHFSSMRDFEDILSGLVRAGFVKLASKNGMPSLQPGIPLPVATNGASARI